MRQNPPGKLEWSEDQLDAKGRYNERKFEALTLIRDYGDSYFGSLELADGLDITRKHASIILLRLKRQGLLVPIEDMRAIGASIDTRAGRDPIIYQSTEKLFIREQLLRTKVGFKASKEQGARQPRSLEL